MARGAPATGGVHSKLEARLQSATEELAAVEPQLWALAVTVAVLDVSLTHAGLQVGLQEANPLMASLIGSAGIAALALCKVAALGIGGACRLLRPRWGPWVSLGLALPWVVAVGVNAALLSLA